MDGSTFVFDTQPDFNSAKIIMNKVFEMMNPGNSISVQITRM